MVRIDFKYEGGLRCTAVHAPSGVELTTDAPVDNQGKGESFSPTDLLATALGSCILTTMAIVAERHGWKFAGATCTVEKAMIADPMRRVGKLTVRLVIPGDYDERARTTLERTANTCPVHKSLGDNVERPIEIVWQTANAKA